MDQQPPERSTSSANAGQGFPAVPASWFHFCTGDALTKGPVSLEICGHHYAGYRTESGRAVVLSGRCSHLGVYLAKGTVCGDRLGCPLHGWEFGPDGVCATIPGAPGLPIPAFARQIVYPAEERGGHVYFFNRPQALFPMPFFDGVAPEEILAAEPFEMVANAPWYFIGANGFDIQHFRMAHDRALVDEPVISSPSPFARRIVASFAVAGDSLPDRLTRAIAGPRVTMDVISWCGTVIFVRAEFARTTSFGIFNVLPLGPEKTLGRVIVWVRRSNNWLGNAAFDPINATIRRWFIRKFLGSDLPRIAGLRYQRSHLIAADRHLADYLAWLASATGSPTASNIII